MAKKAKPAISTKKLPKPSVPKPLVVPEPAPKWADFVLYKPNPAQQNSLKSAPAERAYDRGKRKVVFVNHNTDPILVHFLEPLGVASSNNPLRISAKSTRTVSIDPTAAGRFRCAVEILASMCPTCHAPATAKTQVLIRPYSRLPFREAGAAYAPWQAHPECMYYSLEDGEDDGDDADPIIIIKPS